MTGGQEGDEVLSPQTQYEARLDTGTLQGRSKLILVPVCSPGPTPTHTHNPGLRAARTTPRPGRVPGAHLGSTVSVGPFLSAPVDVRAALGAVHWYLQRALGAVPAVQNAILDEMESAGQSLCVQTSHLLRLHLQSALHTANICSSSPYLPLVSANPTAIHSIPPLLSSDIQSFQPAIFFSGTLEKRREGRGDSTIHPTGHHTTQKDPA